MPLEMGPASRLGRIARLRGGAGRVPESTSTERLKLIQGMSAIAERNWRVIVGDMATRALRVDTIA
jgi:hypothetical protein